MLELSQKLSLEQKLTPQQILLSTLLQLPTLSLEQRIKQELEANPVLEELEEMNTELEEDRDADEERESSDESEEELLDRLEKEEDIDWDKIETDEDSYEVKLPRDPNTEDIDRDDPLLTTPQEDLLEQLNVVTATPKESEIGEYIIWNLRDDGYLDEQMNLETIAHIFDSDTETVETILKKIQRLEPRGMGSRNLRECLMVQLEDVYEATALLAYDILRHAYDEFVNRKFEKIATIVECEMDEVKAAINLIERLNPKPGDGFFNQKTNYIIPDFIVERAGNRFEVLLNDWGTPTVQISPKYRELLAKKNKDRKTKTFIRKKMEAARWFISSIEQRKLTMLKVMNAIVDRQHDFFDKGPQFIKPMIMKDIAEMIHMDISTVSRVANGKYVQTEFGVFELKSFFTEKMETMDGETVSTRIIKSKIRDICAAEDKKKPFSDELLAKKLSEFGYKVARRTVAKYREQLGIPVARLRREIV